MIVRQISVAHSHEVAGAAAELASLSPDLVFVFGHTRFFETGDALPMLKARWFPSAHPLGMHGAQAAADCRLHNQTMTLTTLAEA